MNTTPEPTAEPTDDAPLVDESEVLDPVIDERDKVDPDTESE